MTPKADVKTNLQLKEIVYIIEPKTIPTKVICEQCQGIGTFKCFNSEVRSPVIQKCSKCYGQGYRTHYEKKYQIVGPATIKGIHIFYKEFLENNKYKSEDAITLTYSKKRSDKKGYEILSMTYPYIKYEIFKTSEEAESRLKQLQEEDKNK